MSSLRIELQGETLELLPDRAVFWPARQTLLLADAHWGKTAAFRARGAPLPRSTLPADLERINTLVARHAARRVVILGDLLHARAGLDEHTLATVTSWRAGCAELELLMVRGNHDLRAGDPPGPWGIQVVDGPLADGPFRCQHEPEPAAPDGYVLAGHIHPAALLTGRGGQSLTLPCFWFGRQVGVLPSFGSFTGSAVVRPRPGDQVFVTTGTAVIQVS